MSRNVFENNEPEISEEELKKMAGRVHATLPPLAAGYKYAFEDLDNGRVAVVIETA